MSHRLFCDNPKCINHVEIHNEVHEFRPGLGFGFYKNHRIVSKDGKVKAVMCDICVNAIELFQTYLVTYQRRN